MRADPIRYHKKELLATETPDEEETSDASINPMGEKNSKFIKIEQNFRTKTKDYTN
jgi:hypothetical protein